MEDSFPNISIFNLEEYQDFEKLHAEDIIDIINLGEKILVKHRSFQKDVNTMLDGFKETHNVSIAIAAAITAYARIHMTQFKNNPDFNLYYSDTDSVYLDKPLTNDLVSTNVLGKMKLEYIIEKAIFISPKVYCLETTDGKLIYKVKGLSHDIELTMKDFDNLLNKNTFIKKIQTK
jgi:hypothetical protein